jgi:DNA-directed RNA polymerase specialized sigma24 family protein
MLTEQDAAIMAVWEEPAFRRLLGAMIRGFPGVDPDEAESLIMEVVARCLLDHDQSREVPILARIRSCAKLIMLSLARAARRRRRRDFMVNDRDGGAIVPSDQSLDDIDQVEFMLGKLQERESRMCREYYIMGKSYEEVGESEGCCREKARLDIAAAIAYLGAGV